MAERSKALTFLSRTGGVSVRIPLETYIFILNFSLPPRSEQVNGAVSNEIKHVHSPDVIVVFGPQTQLIIQGFGYSYLQYSFNLKKAITGTTCIFYGPLIIVAIEITLTVTRSSFHIILIKYLENMIYYT